MEIGFSLLSLLFSHVRVAWKDTVKKHSESDVILTWQHKREREEREDGSPNEIDLYGLAIHSIVSLNRLSQS